MLGVVVNATIDDEPEARDDQLAGVSAWIEDAAARGDCETVRRNARALATIDRATYDRLTGEPAIVACLAR